MVLVVQLDVAMVERLIRRQEKVDRHISVVFFLPIFALVFLEVVGLPNLRTLL
jgi:hypothetical protein